MRPSQRAVLEALASDPTRPILLRFDGAIFDPAAVLQEILLANMGRSSCFCIDEFDDSAQKERIPAGSYRFFRYSWLTPVVPRFLELPPDDPHSFAVLGGNNHSICAAIAHVDPGFKVFYFRGTWWLQWLITDPEFDDGPPVLISPEYYLRRRVLAMDELRALYLEDAEAEAEEEAEEEDVEEYPFFVWGAYDFGSLSN